MYSKHGQQVNKITIFSTLVTKLKPDRERDVIETECSDGVMHKTSFVSHLMYSIYKYLHIFAHQCIFLMCIVSNNYILQCVFICIFMNLIYTYVLYRLIYLHMY